MARPLVRIFSALAALLSLSIPGSDLAAQGPGIASDELRLQPGDRIRLLIENEPGLSDTFVVDESGRVLLPLLGLTRVTAEPFAAVRDRIRTGYDRQLVDQDVQITPLLRVAVLGQVQSPGLVNVDPTQTISDILAAAGGFAPEADQEQISLVREGEVVQSRFDPAAPFLQTPLRSGDQVVVAREGWFSRNSSILVSTVASVAAAAITAVIVR